MLKDQSCRNGRPCFGIFLAILLAPACAGCNSKSPVARVRGMVLLDDKPLASGAIVTLPESGRGARGTIVNGGFELGTFGKNDGALIGTHKVAVVATEPVKRKGAEASAGKLLVPQRYTNPDSSELTIDVKAGEVNEPTLKLTSP
jgi:hypothetical protein